MLGRGAGLPHLGAAPGAGRWGRRGARPPTALPWAGGGRSVARIASVFLFALLFVTVALSSSISNLLLALKLRRFHCDKRTNSTVYR